MKGPVIHIFCVKVLHYSESQASRRVSACRLLKEMPELASKIETGELNLTQLNQAKKFFSDENVVDKEVKEKVLDLIEGKTTRESEIILGDLKRVDSPRRMKLELNETTVKKLKEVQALKAHAYSDMDALLVKMCEEVSKVWEIKAKVQRKEGKGNSRYIQVQVKAHVWKRDDAKCQNCGSKYALELDHIKPFALGGKSTTENLRLLCRACNQRRGFVTFYAKDHVARR